MADTQMPEPLRRAIHQLVSDAVQNCQEVLRYTEPDQAHTWKRMTLYRVTDAEDTMNMVALLIAAFCQREGMAPDTLETYLQIWQQRSRAAGPTEAEQAHLADLLDDEAPASAGERGQYTAENAQQVDDDPQKLFTEAVLHGLRARLCDDVDALDNYLPPRVAELARKVAGALEEPQPAPWSTALPARA